MEAESEVILDPKIARGCGQLGITFIAKLSTIISIDSKSSTIPSEAQMANCTNPLSFINGKIS